MTRSEIDNYAKSVENYARITKIMLSFKSRLCCLKIWLTHAQNSKATMLLMNQMNEYQKGAH